MVRPVACQVLAALCAGDTNAREVAERLQLEPNTVWQRIRQMSLTYAQGDLVVFPEGKRSERPAGARGALANTALALSPRGERIAVKWAQRQLEAIEETIRDLKYGDFFEGRSDAARRQRRPRS